MMTKNSMHLKMFIKNKATENSLSTQFIMQNHVFERLLERFSVSKYRLNFILKDGFRQMGEQA